MILVRNFREEHRLAREGDVVSTVDHDYQVLTSDDLTTCIGVLVSMVATVVIVCAIFLTNSKKRKNPEIPDRFFRLL